jgi:hypothetical protein
MCKLSPKIKQLKEIEPLKGQIESKRESVARPPILTTQNFQKEKQSTEIVDPGNLQKNTSNTHVNNSSEEINSEKINLEKINPENISKVNPSNLKPNTKKVRIDENTEVTVISLNDKQIEKELHDLGVEHSVCDLCNYSDAIVEDPLIFCDGCNVVTHKNCSFLPTIPDEVPWFCCACLYSKFNIDVSKEYSKIFNLKKTILNKKPHGFEDHGHFRIFYPKQSERNKVPPLILPAEGAKIVERLEI